MIIFDSTASAFSSTIFETTINTWTIDPFVYFAGAGSIPSTTYTDVITNITWSVKGTNTLTNYASLVSTSTTITVFVQTSTGVGIDSYVIDPSTGNILQYDNFDRGSIGFQLGVSSANSATFEDALGWIIGADNIGYIRARDWCTGTISTTIYEASINSFNASTEPSLAVPKFNTTGIVSTSTYSH